MFQHTQRSEQHFWQYITEDFKWDFQRQDILYYKNALSLNAFFLIPPNDF